MPGYLRLSHSLLAFLWVLLTAGCASQTAMIPEDVGFSEIDNTALDAWRFVGRIAVVTREDSISATVYWDYRRGADLIELTGPLGQGQVRLTVHEGKVSINDGENITQGMIDDVVQHYLKTDVPFYVLRRWIVVDTADEAVARSDARIVNQLGWRISYPEMQQVGGYWLPRKIRAEKPDATIKLVIDEWDLG